MKICRLLPPLLACLTATAPAAERTWDGGDATANMTAALNWNGNTVINAGDSLVFPSGLAIADKTVNNNFAPNTAFDGLRFNDGGYTFNGTIMGVSGTVAGYHNLGTTAFNASLSLLNAINFGSMGTGSFSMGASSQIFLNGFTLNTYGDVTLAGSIAGAGNINLWGGADVSISGAKTFTANVTIRGDSTLTIDNAGGLGAGAGGTTILDGTLELASLAALNIPESIRMTNDYPDISNLISIGGAHTLSGPIEFGGSYHKRIEVEGTSLTLSGVLSSLGSPGLVDKRGPGRLVLSGPASNTFGYLGYSFAISEGELFLNKSGGATAIPSGSILRLGDNQGGPADSAIVHLGASHQISDLSEVQIYGQGWFDLDGRQETINRLNFLGDGHVTTGGGTLQIDQYVDAQSVAETGGEAVISGAVFLGTADSTWWVNGGAKGIDLTVNGTVTSLVPGGMLTKTGPGRFEINGNVSVPLLEVTDGHLTLAGTSPATDLDCHGVSADLTGTAGEVTIGGGYLIVGPFVNGSRQTLQCGSFSMANGASYLQESQRVENSDAVIVSGTVTLNQPDLVLFVGFPAPEIAIGEEVVIIENDGIDPVIGSFSGYPEGSLIANSLAQSFVVSYQGGDGNDVSLTRIIAPTGVTRIWDGLGADNNWMTAANWNPNGQPQPGDDLVFPTVAARKWNLNNFPAGTTFNSITVHGTGYDLGGNGIMLNEKVEFTSASGSHFIRLPLTLALDATISVTGNGYVEQENVINLNGKTLTLHNAGGGSGDLVMSGLISGNSATSKVRKTGPGRVTWDDVSHTYLGATHIEAGSLVLRAGARLGDPAGSTTINAGATVELSSTIDGASGLSSEHVYLQGRILVNAGPFGTSHGGVIEAAAETATIEVNGNTFDAYIITGSVLHKTGTGIMYIHWTNTLTGGLFVDAGELRSEIVNGGCDAPIYIGATGLPAKLTLSFVGNQIHDNGAVLLMNPSAVFDIRDETDTMGALTMNGGTVTGTVAARLTVGSVIVQSNAATAVITAPIVNKAGDNGILQVADGASAIDLRIDSVVYGTGFDKTGAGRVDFMAGIPQTGLNLLDIQEGSALFFGNSRYTDIHLNGGLVGGNGTVGSITSFSGGIISPGASAGALGGNIGTWNAAATLRMELNGLSPGSEYDQYFVNTELNLGDTALDLSVGIGFDPAPGAEFMIVRNIGGFPINGTFAGVPENGYVSTAGAKVFQVTYTGGDGDDVVLTRVEVDPPYIVNHVMFPGVDENKGKNGTGLTVHGTPGLSYQLETSTNLQTWTKHQFVKADLLTGLMLFEFFNPETDPKLFLRVGLP